MKIKPEHLKMTTNEAIRNKLNAETKVDRQYWHEVAKAIRLKKVG